MDFGLTFFGIAYVVAIVIPGLIFKRFYFQGKFSKQFFDGLFVDRLLTNILWGLFIQLITIFSYCWFFDVKSTELYTEINSLYTDYNQQKIPEFKFEYILHSLRYLMATIITAIASGWGLHLLVRFLKFDILFSIFRFSNQWHYYFSGEALRFKEFKKFSNGNTNKVISTEVDVVVKESDGITNMFTGFLTQYTLCRTGELETIYLTDTKRFVKRDDNRFHSKVIPGDCFVIPYNNVLNLNVRYNVVNNHNPTTGIIKKVISMVILLLTILAVFFVIIYPWFVAPGFWRKLISCCVLLVSWISLMNFVLSVVGNDRDESNLKTPLAKIFVFFIAVFFGMWGFVIAKTTTWIAIYEYFKFW
ncbi:MULTISPECIES: hypothetical protein [unclassified Sphingobacterium]|uniref:hypothetical protein n=1 Tax=unclassified Sphingobacterium TaxID=2609468 RepID=UPI0025CBE2FF|nr:MULTISPECIES: hypothetical protein [unclassified Sphingobacterium]